MTTNGTTENSATQIPRDEIESPKSPRYTSLDIWRGIACLMVVVYHSTFYAQTDHSDGTFSGRIIALTSYLHLGVPMFFVISGYCISATADSARRKSIGFREYMVRRVRRIFPPYWVCVVMTVVLISLTESYVPQLYTDSNHPFADPQSLSLGQWIGNVTLTESWRFHFAGVKRFFMAHAWTLCYEEQFYIVVGLVLLVSKRHFFSAMFLISGLVLVLVLVSDRPEYSDFLRGFFFDGSWLMFAAGILVYFQRNYAKQRTFVALNALLAVAIAVSARHIPKELDFPTAFLFAALLIGISGWDSQLVATPALRPFAYCGTMCYSLYLVHWPIVKACSHYLHLCGLTSATSTVLLTIPACMLVSLLAAHFFHVSVERRFLNPPSGNVAKCHNGKTACSRRESALEA